MDGARVAAERRAKTYCIVISARGPTEREIEAVARIVPKIKETLRAASLRLPRPAHAGAGPAAQGLRRRQGEPQSQHQRAVLPRNLHDAHLSRSHRHAAGRPLGRHGTVQRRHHRAWAKTTPTWCGWPSSCASWASNRSRVNFLNPIDGTPLAGIAAAQSALLPQGAGDDAARQPQSELRIAGGREMHLGSLQAARSLRRQLDLRRRLSDHQGPSPRSRLPDDRRTGLRRHPR